MKYAGYVHSALRIATGLALALSVGACKGKEEKGTPLGAAPAQAGNAVRDAIPAEGRVALDKGNELFRQKKYDEALAAYREAAIKSPGQSAPWFGVYMVANKQNNKALADSAQAELKKISPDAALADSEMQKMHEKVGAGMKAGALPAGPLPAGHPAMPPKSE